MERDIENALKVLYALTLVEEDKYKEQLSNVGIATDKHDDIIKSLLENGYAIRVKGKIGISIKGLRTVVGI